MCCWLWGLSRGYGQEHGTCRGLPRTPGALTQGQDNADYAVGLSSGHMREGGLDDETTRLLEIEAELGPDTRFPGRKGFKP